MAKSRISADVRHANSALARFLMLREEEEQLLQIGKRKPTREDEEKLLLVGRGRWRAPYDFRTPTCMVDRPRTLDGATSFHFAYETVTKRAVPVLDGKPLEGLPRPTNQAALDHARYIERAGAPEHSEASVHSEYVERDGAIEMVDSTALMHAALDRQIAIANGETPGPLRVTLPSVFSNISDDPEDRQSYWRQIEESERTPRTHELVCKPECSPLWWQDLEAATGLDEDLMRYLLAFRQMSERLAAEGEDAPTKPAPFKVKGKGKVSGEERAGRLLAQVKKLRGYDPSDPPIRFKSGPGGRTQIRMVSELPHELNAEDRARIVMRFCELLGSLETRKYEDGTERRVGLMYTAVVHAPDAHNDPRNYHLHIIAHDRPARWLDEHGCWDFQYEEDFKHKGEKRVRRPFKQKKITQVTQSSHVTKLENSGRDFLPFLRREYARISNEMLEERGIVRRYDPRTYAKMGIERTPTEHLGTAAAALESIGVPTAVGTRNAISIWRDAEDNISREVRQDDQRSRAAQVEFEKACVTLREEMPDHTQLPDFERLVAERKRLSRNLPEDREALMQLDNLEAKAKSRATRAASTCQVYLSEIANERAEPPISSMSKAIETRFRDANAHLNAIATALEPHRRILAQAGRDVKGRLDRIEEIDESLVELLQQSELAVRVNARMARIAEAERATRGLRVAIKEADAIASNREASAESVKPKRVALSSPGIDRSNEGTADTKIVQEKAIADGQVRAAPITIDGIAIVEPTIPLTPRQNDPHEIPAAPLGAANLTGSGKSPFPNERKAPENPVGAQKVSKPVLPGAASNDSALEGGKVTKIPYASTNTSIDEKVLRNAQIEQAWNSVIKKISSQRIPIFCEEMADGSTRYTVRNLNDEEHQSLEVRKFASRTQRRLKTIYEKQRYEVNRLCSWIKIYGSDPDALILDDEEPRLNDTRKAVTTHWQNWKSDAEVVAAICEARDARDMEKVPAGEQADHKSEMTSTSAAEGAITETVLQDDLSNENIVPDVECPRSEEKDPKVGGEFVRDGRSDGHEDGEEKSDEASQVESIESTEDDEWLRTLDSFASRSNKKVRW